MKYWVVCLIASFIWALVGVFNGYYAMMIDPYKGSLLACACAFFCSGASLVHGLHCRIIKKAQKE